jgi:hypothetical protein
MLPEPLPWVKADREHPKRPGGVLPPFFTSVYQSTFRGGDAHGPATCSRMIP